MNSILSKIRKFRDERDWMQFHDPKNMAISISLEAAELLEHFQWKTKEEVEAYLREKTSKAEVADEMADIAMYLFEMADNMGVDLIQVMDKKLVKNAKKYPVAKAKGMHTKYNRL